MPTITCVEDPSITYTSPPLPPVKKKKGLWIAFGENRQYEAQYSNGELLNGKGQPYEGEGVRIKNEVTIKPTNLFLKLAVNALNKIALAEQEIGTDVIKTLQESEFKFTIVEKINMFLASQETEKHNLWMNNACANLIKLRKGKLIIDRAPFDGIGSGGSIRWKPSSQSEIKTNKGTKIGNSKILLAHEMFHAYDANFGDLDTRRMKNGVAITQYCEARAVYFGNMLRPIFKIKYLRSSYHKNDINCELIDKEGNPIYYPSISESLKEKK